MRISEHGLALLKRLEGVRFDAYKDSGGVWTIGYGHTGPDVAPDSVVTPEEAERLLRSDLDRFERAVSGGVTQPINQNQFDAFTIFAYNVGVGAFRRSTALRRFNAGEDPERVVEAMKWFNKIGYRVIQGLVHRREEEANLFLTPPEAFR